MLVKYLLTDLLQISKYSGISVNLALSACTCPMPFRDFRFLLTRVNQLFNVQIRWSMHRDICTDTDHYRKILSLHTFLHSGIHWHSSIKTKLEMSRVNIH